MNRINQTLTDDRSAENAERARLAILAFRKWLEKQNNRKKPERTQLPENVKITFSPPRLVPPPPSG